MCHLYVIFIKTSNHTQVYTFTTIIMVVPFHAWEQIECSCSDDEELGIGISKIDNGVYIDLPLSIASFKWASLITIDDSTYDSSEAKSLNKDAIPDTGPITRKSILRRMKQKMMLETAINYDAAKEELELIRINVHNIVNSWLCHFIIFTAKAIGMTLGGSEITSWNDYIKYIQYHIHTKDDAMMVVKSAYMSFQHNIDYKYHMTFAICKELNYAIIKRHGIKSSGNFIEKIITYRQNEIRKQICRQLGKFNGYTYRVIRACSEDKTKTMQRNYPKYFHEWMLQWKESTYLAKKKGRPFGSSNSVTKATGSKERGLGPYNDKKKKKKNTKMTREELMADIAVQEDEMKQKRLLLATLMETEEDSNSKLFVLFCNWLINCNAQIKSLYFYNTGVEIVTNKKQKVAKRRSPAKEKHSGSVKNKKKTQSVRSQLTQHSESDESEEGSNDEDTKVQKRRSPRE